MFIGARSLRANRGVSSTLIQFASRLRQARKGLLNKARALNRMVTVHELDTEPLRLRVYHQRVARRQFHERVTPRLLVEVCARDVEHRLTRVHRLTNQLANYTFSQAREQDEMPRAQQPQRL